MLAYVTPMSKLVQKIPAHIPPILDSAEKRGRTEVDAMGPAIQRAAVYGRALETLERMTRERVVEYPFEFRRRWWHRIPLRWTRRRA
ncbi:hypothetical protein [Geodermatophilus sp. SYSU D00700]